MVFVFHNSMKKQIILLCLVVFGCLLFAEDMPDPYAILDAVENQYKYGNNDYSCTVSLVIKKPDTPDEQVQFKMFERESTDQFSMIQLLPEADKGAGYLKEGDNLWYYDPIGRKFSHTSLKENIGDSDVKTSDMNKEYSYRDDYEVTSMESGKLGSYDVWIIAVKAITSVPTYAKDIYFIRKDLPVILKQENYSASDRLMRTLLVPKYTKVDNFYIATQAIIRDEINKGEQTQQIISDISFKKLPDKIFTKAYLEQLN